MNYKMLYLTLLNINESIISPKFYNYMAECNASVECGYLCVSKLVNLLLFLQPI